MLSRVEVEAKIGSPIDRTTRAVCGLRFAVCGLRFAVCGLRFAVAVCGLRFAACRLRKNFLANLPEMRLLPRDQDHRRPEQMQLPKHVVGT